MALVGMTEVSKDEYRKLLELKGRVDAFVGYVKTTEYSIERNKCAAILGFELNHQEKENAGTDRK